MAHFSAIAHTLLLSSVRGSSSSSTQFSTQLDLNVTTGRLRLCSPRNGRTSLGGRIWAEIISQIPTKRSDGGGCGWSWAPRAAVARSELHRQRHCHQVWKIHLGFFGPKSVSGRLVVVECRAPRRWTQHRVFYNFNQTWKHIIILYNARCGAKKTAPLSHLKKNMWTSNT